MTAAPLPLEGSSGKPRGAGAHRNHPDDPPREAPGTAAPATAAIGSWRVATFRDVTFQSM